MEEVEFQGRKWTWASNWHKEGFIEARFDRFFGSSKWLLENESALVKHIENQSSDHSMLLFDTKPVLEKGRKGFSLIKDGLINLELKRW